MFRNTKGIRRGFTLIELLVVISLIAILLAILCPVLKSARSMAQQAQCAANLRTIGGSIAYYCGDNSGIYPTTCSLPGSSEWVFWQPGRNMDQSALAPYLGLHGASLKSIFICPAQSLDNQNGFQGGGAYMLTYSMNCSVDVYYPMILRLVKNAPGKIIVYDENQNADDDQFWYGTDRDTLAGRHGGVDTQAANLNGTGETSYERGFGNVLWCDGHVSLADNNMCHTAAMNDFMYNPVP